MVSSPGSPDRVRRGPDPCSFSARPGEVITIVAGTFFAIPPGPTRAQRASANSGEIGRGSQPSCAATYVLHVDEELHRVHRPIERTEEQRWPAPDGLDELLPPHAVPRRLPHFVRVAGQRWPHESWPAVGSPFTDDEVRCQIGGEPTLAQGGCLGTELDEQIAEGLAFLLSEAEWWHWRILRKRANLSCEQGTRRPCPPTGHTLDRWPGSGVENPSSSRLNRAPSRPASPSFEPSLSRRSSCGSERARSSRCYRNTCVIVGRPMPLSVSSWRPTSSPPWLASTRPDDWLTRLAGDRCSLLGCCCMQ